MSIDNSDKAMHYKKSSATQQDHSLNATLPDYPLRINGNLIKEMSYPIVVYNNVPYLPLTYQITNSVLDIKYKYSKEDGISIGAKDEKFRVKPYDTITYSIDKEGKLIDLDKGNEIYIEKSTFVSENSIYLHYKLTNFEKEFDNYLDVTIQSPNQI